MIPHHGAEKRKKKEPESQPSLRVQRGRKSPHCVFREEEKAFFFLPTCT